jgi:hypothetical protein
MSQVPLRRNKPDRSIFHTKELRSPATRIQLTLVFLCLMSGMTIAMVFAQSPAKNARMDIHDQPSKTLNNLDEVSSPALW